MANYRLFLSKAPGIMAKLKRDFAFSTIQAAAILGNIGHECNGFQSMQEIRPISGRGGYGWCQWTGPRRRSFEAWCDSHGLDINSDEANYGFLKRELSTSHSYAKAALLRENELVRAVRVFERKFLVAGIPHYPGRERYAQLALDAYGDSASQSLMATFGVETAEDEDYLDAGLEMLAAGTAFRASPALESSVLPGPVLTRPVGHRSDCGCGESRLAPAQLWAETGTRPQFSARAEPESGLLAAGPTIHATAAWGARPPAAAITLLGNRPKGIVIHHTASANVADTSLAHAKALAREIQDFHMGPSRGWIDTGQHFTVSRGGHILEGRHRSLEAARAGRRHVLGAHAGSACNNDYVGIENEGTYMTGLPPANQWQALVALCAWLCNQYGMSPDDIIGHRQCKSTDCPGDKLFAQLGALRRDVEDAL